MPTNDEFSGVSNCYVFKSRLQEYAQKKGLPTPVYETTKEGPSHEPSFRSAVIVNDVRYDSLPGFFNRKAAEQSAAEVALRELAKSDEVECISQPVHETGLCKNLLQEYAQKMNYAIPVYHCQKIETPGRATLFKCAVEIGGIQYIGASAKTKKEAEIKAARTALLAIQSSASETSQTSLGNFQLTVIPSRKRGAEIATVLEEAVNVPKARKARFKKKMLKKKLSRAKVDHNRSERTGKLDVLVDHQSGLESDQTDASLAQATGHGVLTVFPVESLQNGRSVPEFCNKETTNVISTVNQHVSGISENVSPTTVVFSEIRNGKCAGTSTESNEDATKVSGVTLVQMGPSVMAGLNPLADSIEGRCGQNIGLAGIR